MDLLVTCPSCGRSAAPFDSRSKWCEPCVAETLAEQEELRYAPQPREVIDFGGGPSRSDGSARRLVK